MTDIDKSLLEQLCAWMDGELPADEARFLQRRLQNDPALRAQWERWQLASACLRGQPVRTMPAELGERIAGAVAAEPTRPGRWPWVAGLAAAVLVAV
ncbi:MAG TPA: sigma-E factor negative regulatory protein, partial [Arenimonas sp.]|nr:sigma-E factor negative regulatory protein [Arenimonas sp.]